MQTSPPPLYGIYLLPGQGWALAVIIKIAGVSRVPVTWQAECYGPCVHRHVSFPRQPCESYHLRFTQMRNRGPESRNDLLKIA